MANKRPKPEEIVSKLRQVEVLMGQGQSRLDAIRRIIALMRRKQLDCVVVKRTAPARPVVYVCPSSQEIFVEKYISGKELA